jgi:hypothetical protein
MLSCCLQAVQCPGSPAACAIKCCLGSMLWGMQIVCCLLGGWVQHLAVPHHLHVLIHTCRNLFLSYSGLTCLRGA